MSHAKLTDDALDKLENQYPEVTSLEYCCTHKHPTWAQLAYSLPNLTHLDFGYKHHRDSDATPQLKLDDELFTHFNKLESIEGNKYSLQFTSAAIASMQQLHTIKHAITGSPETLTAIGKLPALRKLNLTYEGHAPGFLCVESIQLEQCRIKLEDARQVGIDLTRSVSLTDVDIISGMPGYDDEPNVPLTLSPLMLPHSVQTVKLVFSNETYLNGPVFSAGTQAKEVHIECDNIHFAPEALGHADKIDWLYFRTRQAPSLPDDLLTNINTIDSLWLLPYETPARLDALLSNQTAVQDLHLSGERLSIQGPIVLPALTSASISGLSTADLNWLVHSTALTSLTIQNCGELGDADILSQLPQLSELKLGQFNAQALPLSVRQHNNLTKLTLYIPTLQEFGNLDAMSQLCEVKIYVEDDQYPIMELPKLDDLHTAPALHSFMLEVSEKYNRWDNAASLATLSEQVDCKISIPNREARATQLTKQLSILQRSPLTDDEKCHCWQVLLGAPKPKDLPTDTAVLGDRFYLTFMEAKYTPFKAYAINWLRQKAISAVEQRPLGADSVLFVNGKIPFTATELKAKADELGFTISKKLTDNVTHVVLGANPKNTAALMANYLFIDDTALKQWFEQAAPQFLQTQGSEAMIEGVLAMLDSPDVTSHHVAAQMLQQGGVTEDLFIPLFLILKTTSDKNLRKEIKKLLAGYGDEHFQVAVQDRIFFEDNLRGVDWENTPTGEGPMYQKLKGLPKRWGRELTITFAKAYFDRFGEGLLWILGQKEECTQRQAIIAEFIEGECLNWHKGCGFTRVLEGADEERLTNCQRYPEIYMQYQYELGSPKTRLPAQLPATSKITELDMHNCYLGELPANIEHYVDVTTINLHFNHLSKLPAKMSKLSQLEALDLSYNHFEDFPAVLFKLKKLKRLDLRRASRPLSHGYSQQHGYKPIRAPQTFRDAFPNCEILEDAIDTI
ncbi:BRCT domain-containing protein [Photobacterium nomapromontoriensis]|uniref:BRCT domain-containing protein n=1 Tax=Photobacterium nomapromontoriensis TaxID=2910237 RepID=UPI003D0D94A0